MNKCNHKSEHLFISLMWTTCGSPKIQCGIWKKLNCPNLAALPICQTKRSLILYWLFCIITLRGWGSYRSHLYRQYTIRTSWHMTLKTWEVSSRPNAVSITSQIEKAHSALSWYNRVTLLKTNKIQTASSTFLICTSWFSYCALRKRSQWLPLINKIPIHTQLCKI